MAQPDFSLKKEFSWVEFCETSANELEDWSLLDDSTRSFLDRLNLSRLHPACLTKDFESGAPPMGPLVNHDYHESLLDTIVTVWKQATPTTWAMGELWLRLFAGLLAPLGIAVLMAHAMDNSTKISPQRRRWSAVVVVLTVASSVVLSTDTLYVFEFGPEYGLAMLGLSSVLAAWNCYHRSLTRAWFFLFALWGLTIYLSWDSKTGGWLFGGEDMPRSVQEGLYYSPDNELVKKLVEEWPEDDRTYSFENGATPWMPTGDSRTGLPFLMNFWPDLELTKGWIPTVDGEAIRLEFCFPKEGHDPSKPLFLVLHGLNGGDQEQLVKDFGHRVAAQGMTMVIMVARGLMETPVKGWNVFHGARTDDVQEAAKTLRKGLGPEQTLVGVGYSMGAIILANYAARSGKDCYVDAAIAISGGLDMRPQEFFYRARRLWQPFLAQTLREQFVVGKYGERYRERLSKSQMLQFMRATDVTAVDIYGVVAYNDFDDVVHYYSEMSAMGDIDRENPESLGRIENVSVPLCILSALDDPLLTWKNVASNEGYMHPSQISQSGSGNLMLVLTKRGGHVGWPTGVNPSIDKWKWMNNAAITFGNAADRARRSMKD